ncbi:MAG: transposase, partial [Nitrosomonadales bacterium]|nr:transposase [Nitrosomonadales bacterium]
MSDRKAVVKAWSSQYRKAGKKEKGRILDDLVALTGYNRWYVVGLMRWDGKVIRAGRRVRLVGDLRKKAKRTRQRLYDETVQHGLKEIWAIMVFICGKRLAAILPEVIPILEKHREIVLDMPTRKKLLQISASSIDRLLA